MTAAINNNLGNLLTNVYSVPQGVANVAGSDSDFAKTWSAFCAIPVVGTDLAGSTYRFGRINSSQVLHSIEFASTALTAGAVSLGLYAANGAVVSVHLFATSIDCSSAVGVTNERYNNLALTTAGKRVWELLGLSSDPAVFYDVVGTSTTGATVAGTLFCRCTFAD